MAFSHTARLGFLALSIILQSKAMAVGWDELLQRKYPFLDRMPASVDEKIGTPSLKRISGVEYLCIQAGQITLASWPEGAPRPVYMAWCPTDRVASLLGSLEIKADPASPYEASEPEVALVLKGGRANGPAQQYDTEGQVFLVKSRRMLSEGAKLGNPMPFPVKGSFIVVEERKLDSQKVELTFWQTEFDWEATLDSMASTHCWLTPDSPPLGKPEDRGVKKGFEGRRGAFTVFMSFAAPGGRVYFGTKTFSAAEIPSDSSPGASKSIAIEWGHGVVSLKDITNPRAVGAALLANGIPAKSKLIGRQVVDVSTARTTALALQKGLNGDAIAVEVAKLCPLPTKR
jgi:hypothetical protein